MQMNERSLGHEVPQTQVWLQYDRPVAGGWEMAAGKPGREVSVVIVSTSSPAENEKLLRFALRA
jgi:hypothetical protein